MRVVVCNYCGRDEAELVNEGPDLLLGLPGRFRLVRCRHCGLIYQNPQLTLEELRPHYPDTYPRYTIAEEAHRRGAENAEKLKRWSERHALERQRRRIEGHYGGRPGRLLDVGCATGLFLATMRAAGWTVAGVEVSEYAAAYARNTLGLAVQTGTLAEAQFADSSFDVVTLWDVLEHVADPKETLAEVGRILRPGGLLVVSTPNPTGIEARLFGRYWVGWERPRHLHVFTPVVLRRYLEDAGFAVKSLESFSGRLSVTLLSVEYWLRGRGMAEERWRPWLRAVYNWPLRLLTWPVYKLGETLNMTTSITVFAQRRSPQ